MVRRVTDAQIRIVRDAQAWPGRLRSYTVVLDGDKVGKVARDDSLTVKTKPGHHELHLVVDWARSPSLTFDLAAGQEVVIGCWPNATWYSSILYWMTLGRSRYIGIAMLPGDIGDG
jgi:hypothetical protein